MIIIDFDDTLFDTKAWKQARFAPLEALGIPSELVKKTYTDIRNTPGITYTNKRHAERLSSHGFPFEEIMKVFDDTTLPPALGRFLFPDAIDALRAFQALGHRLILLTHGDPAFQKIKVHGTGIGEFFDDTYFVDKNKEQFVRPIADGCEEKETVWLINDKVEETRKMIDLCPRLAPVLKVCADFPLRDYEASGFPYFHTLTEIVDYVRTHRK